MPNQVSRTGQCETSAARLKRSSTRKAQTTPQLSRNQNQRRSQLERASGRSRSARAGDREGEGQCPGDPEPGDGAAGRRPGLGCNGEVLEDEENGEDRTRQTEARGQVVRERDGNQKSIKD